MVVWLIVLVVFLAGWIYGARLVLTAWMSQLRCTNGLHFIDICEQHHPAGCRRPIGELRTRTLSDGVAALGVGLAWPVLILAHLLTATTPLTPGEAKCTIREQERRIAEQSADIERLHRQIGVR